LRITADGFNHIAESIFRKGSFEEFHIRRVMRYEWSFITILGIKILTSDHPETENYELLKRVVAKHYREAGIINYCKYLIFLYSPISFLKLLQSIFRFQKHLRIT